MKIKKFDYTFGKDTYIVYVIKNNKTYEYWLQKENFGIMYFMFGFEEYNLEILENNLFDYVKIYKDEFEKEE